MNRAKLIEIVNDLIADNDFNMDLENKRSNEISIKSLMSELEITMEDLKMDLGRR